MIVFRAVCNLGALLTLCSACTRVPQTDDRCVASIINHHINKDVHWNSCCKDAQIQVGDAIHHFLEQELTIDSAVQIALLNNPDIQATFEEIGIAQADLIQAGLFQNPIFDAYVRFPDHQLLQLNTAFSITQNFLDLFLIPLRKKIAAVELEQAHLRVANAVLDLAFDVQETFYNLQVEQIKQHLLSSLVETTEVSSALAKAQRQQGNINDLELNSRMNEYLESKVEFAQNQIEIIRLRERMNKLLGLSSSNYCWKITENLPELTKEEIPTEYLESIALSQRLDLQIARWEVERIAKTLGIKQWWAYTNIAAGISTEHEAEGFQETGPAFAGSIPLFNYGQADRARLHAMYCQSRERQKALEIAVLSEVNSTIDQLTTNRHLVLTYQKELLPLQEQITSLSQKFYNTMSLSIYKLLFAKRQELQIQINYNLNLKNYWISRVKLDRALGGGLNLAIENYCPSDCCNIPKESK